MSKNESIKYRYDYHISAKFGWLNDPNGLCWFNDRFHVFFQTNPFGNKPGKSHWGHVSSENLVDWQEEEFALKPDQDYDQDGCYSGSAIAYEGKLVLMYTGHKNLPNSYVESQCIAVSKDGITFEKVVENPVIATPPIDNTNRFRDPKIGRDKNGIYAVVGGESDQNRGQVNFYRMEETIINWQYQKKLAVAQKKDGTMWECPDYFELEDESILIISPKGMENAGISGFAAVYLQGNFTLEEPLTTYEMTLIDEGQDFYAPQTFWDPIKKRRIMFGWFGMPGLQEKEQQKQVGALTIPRVLDKREGRLYFLPLPELIQLRTKEKIIQSTSEIDECSEIVLSNLNNYSKIHLRIYTKQKHSYYEIDYKDQTVTISFKDTLRDVQQSKEINMLKELRLFLDHGLTELFINEGEFTFTNKCDLTGSLQIDISEAIQAKCYKLRKAVA
ncbi:glycoside hydrolase family 32 protein [Enterococcus canintestini]|uniref:beta-fructofuranosidase n=1 Tax=Enterococcus canintestini TaxID=317010 RepID=A0A267HVD4_9ENTE|nr:glycoside hydrolase family 32 protein [Enterococcus canintestini]PAB01615.1 hypothetical protein AKL21_03960 [Enterococcus canintestini]